MQPRSKFFILNGRNGAKYIINSTDPKRISESLKFYKARNLKQNIFKYLLRNFLIFFNFLQKFYLFNIFISYKEVDLYLKNLFNTSIEFNKNSSMLISSTLDKIIINNMGYFHKYAFSLSFKKSENELNTYKLIKNSKKFFAISEVYDIKLNKSSCNFKMKSHESILQSNYKSKIDKEYLAFALHEFFNCSKLIYTNVKEYADNIILNISSTHKDKAHQLFNIQKVFYKYREKFIPLGLVHGDFKPWNILENKPLVFFDFEEVIFNGLPLSDFLNYTIDPEIKHNSFSKIENMIFTESNIFAFKHYLMLLKIELSISLLLYLHLLKKIEILKDNNQDKDANIYLNFLLFIDHGTHRLQ